MSHVTSHALPNSKTPQHILKGDAPTTCDFRIFGLMCWSRIVSQAAQKVDNKTKQAIFIGYQDQSEVNRLLDRESKLKTCKDVVFEESASWATLLRLQNSTPLYSHMRVKSWFTWMATLLYKTIKVLNVQSSPSRMMQFRTLYWSWKIAWGPKILAASSPILDYAKPLFDTL